MNKLKTYVIYGFAFSIIVSFVLFLIESLMKGSIMEGMRKFTFLQFILWWVGGMFIGFIRDKLGVLNME